MAVSLSKQGKHADVVEIQRGAITQETSLFGAEHQATLLSASNLAVSLWFCGQKTEAEQLLRGTLALCRHALGPTHELTQSVLENIRALGLAS